MSSLLEALGPLVDGNTVKEMSRQIGSDEGTTGNALAAALPILMTALTRNASTSQGADSLANALSKDHDGGVLDDLPGYFKGFQGAAGNAILGHVLGSRRGAVEAGLGKSSGLDPAAIAKLLAMAAPLIMGALGRAKRQGNLGAGSLSAELNTQHKRFQDEIPGAGGLLTSLLDKDGDGSISDDLGKIGMGMLGKFLGGGGRR